jgi:hypothetical protein
MSAALWQQAPATAAIQQRPMHELVHAQARLAECSQILADIEALLARDDVDPADKLALLHERATTRISAMACANIITACEERMRQHHRQMQQRHGYLL